MKDIIFFYPDYVEKIRDKKRTEFPPLGMLSIASVFKNNNFNVKVIAISNDMDLNKIPNAYIYAYAITASVTYPYFVEFVKKIKNKSELNIAGGAHVTCFPKDVLLELGLDTVFVGEAEYSVSKWCENGCVEKGIIIGERIDVNLIDYPYRKLLPDDKMYLNKRLAGQKNNILSITTSRGCLYNCQFCAIHSRGKVSYKSPKYFEEEIKLLMKDYPLCEGLVLLDETFTFNEEHTIRMSNILYKYNIPYECNTRADRLTEGVMKQLIKTNCKEVKIGLETGSQSLLKKSHKGIILKKVKETIIKAGEMGLPIKLYLMHGFPFENIDTVKETIDFLKSIKQYINRVALYRFVPLPGSPIYENELIKKLDWSKYTIYDNDNWWWGTENDYQELLVSYNLLKEYIDNNFKM